MASIKPLAGCGPPATGERICGERDLFSARVYSSALDFAKKGEAEAWSVLRIESDRPSQSNTETVRASQSLLRDQ